MPEFNGRLVGHQVPLAGILDEDSPQRRIHPQVAEGVAAGEMHEVRHLPEDLPLGALAGAGRTEQQDGAVFQAEAGLQVRR